MMVILPTLALMPMFRLDKRLTMFQDGLWVGIFAPGQRQAQITFSRIKSRIQSKSAVNILTSPEFGLSFSTSNGQTVTLSNGSFVTSISASEQSNIEGESFKLLVADEAQDISNSVLRKCLTGDTLVLLKNGTSKRIEDIVRDGVDSVVCFDFQMKELTSKVPFEFHDNGEQDVYEICLDNGESIEATINHPFYSYNQKTRGEKCRFRTVEELIESMDRNRPLRIGVPDTLPFFAPTENFDYERGLLLGHMLGNGSMTNTYSTPQFSSSKEVCYRLLKIIHKTVSSNVYMSVYSIQESSGLHEVAYCTPGSRKDSNDFKRFLVDEGIWGFKGAEKCLPDKSYSRKFYLGLIEGLIETDGCVSVSSGKPTISFANISSKLVWQLKHILLKFGIHSTYRSRSNNHEGAYGRGNNHLLHTLSIKSVVDINRFAEQITLFMKRENLDLCVLANREKADRQKSKYYPSTMRFCNVKSIKYVGRKPTFCLSVEGRNFIANNMISSNSISPMGAAYNATFCKIGTPTTYRGDFYYTIQRNKKEYERKTKDGVKGIVRNHFEYDCDVAAKYNPKYHKYIEKEKRVLGEKSDEFLMSYKLQWIFQRGMFIELNDFLTKCGDMFMERVSSDRHAVHVAGIDLGGTSRQGDPDSTVITIAEVDWSTPVVFETRTDPHTNEETTFAGFNTYVKDWLEIVNPDYEAQYELIVEYLRKWNIRRCVCDATREISIAHRLRANMDFEVVPYVFNGKSKSDLYKHLEREINSGRLRIPLGEYTIKTREFDRFITQMEDLQKDYRGALLVVEHPPGKGNHDDYPDSLALCTWGCSWEGEIHAAETYNTKKIFEQSGNRTKSKNTLTARRKRRAA